MPNLSFNTLTGGLAGTGTKNRRWYIPEYDKPKGTCTIEPESVEGSVSVGGGSGMGSSEFVIERLSNYICNAGLLDIEGNSKLGWEEFTKQVQMNTNS